MVLSARRVLQVLRVQPVMWGLQVRSARRVRLAPLDPKVLKV